MERDGDGDGDGDVGPAHALARRTGTSVSKAAEVLRTVRRLESQPDLAAAARRGGVSAEQGGGHLRRSGRQP